MSDPTEKPQTPKTSTPPVATAREDSLLSLVQNTFQNSGGSDQRASTLFPKWDHFPTGVDAVDQALNGGVHGITILAGRPGVGKTAFLSQVAVKAVQSRTDNAVVIYSLDMSRMEFVQRLLIAATANPEPQFEANAGEGILATLSNGAMNQIFIKEGFTSLLTRDLTADEKRRFVASGTLKVGTAEYKIKTLQKLGDGEYYTLLNTVFNPISINTSFFGDSSIADDCKPITKTGSVKNLMIIIDLFQDIRCDGNIANRRDDQILEFLKENELSLQKLFPNGNVSFLISSAVRKESNSKVNQSSNIGMDDVIGSTNLGYSADAVLGLNFKKPASEAENEVVLEVLKGRDGVTRGPIDLRYQFKTGQFVTKSQPRSQPKKKAAKKRRDDLKN